MKQFVRIQSEKTIMVTQGLSNEDVTNKDAHVPDRLKVSPTWPKLTCLIRKGAGWYPSEIANWNSVKALAADKILTIGEDSDTPDGDIEKLKKTKEELNLAAKEVLKEEKSSKKVVKDISLDAAAGE